MAKILVIDDEQKNLRSLERIFLHEDDIQLKTLQDNAVAIDTVLLFLPDVVLLDIMMPDPDGYEICKMIKKNPVIQNIMVLLVSGKSSVTDRLKGYEVDADDYITKPYDPEELKAKVRILLRLKAANDSLIATNNNLEALVEQRTRELIKKERQAVVGQMVQGIVHNLKGPLTGAYGFIDLAMQVINDYSSAFSKDGKEVPAEVSEVQNHLTWCLKSQKNLKTLIENLLLKGRRDAALQTEKLNLNEVVTAECDFLNANMAFKHEIKKQFELDADLPVIEGVYSDFSQLFCNLIQNAADAMLGEKIQELTVKTFFDDNNIFVAFTDSGCGIAPDILERIFEPFFTTKSDSKTLKQVQSGGTGLGLFTCHEIIKYYQGSITVKSSPGQGTCFLVRVPKDAP